MRKVVVGVVVCSATDNVAGLAGGVNKHPTDSDNSLVAIPFLRVCGGGGVGNGNHEPDIFRRASRYAKNSHGSVGERFVVVMKKKKRSHTLYSLFQAAVGVILREEKKIIHLYLLFFHANIPDRRPGAKNSTRNRLEGDRCG